MPDDLAERGRARLWDELLVHDGTTYGLPFKTAHKSAVWYRPSVFREAGVQPPTQWSEWLDAEPDPVARQASGRWRWALETAGCSPTSWRTCCSVSRPRRTGRWRRSTTRVRREQPQFAAALRLLGDDVVGSWRVWRAEWSARSSQQFPDAIVEVFGHRRAAMVLASDFAEPVVRSFAADPDDVGLFTFPPFARAPQHRWWSVAT